MELVKNLAKLFGFLHSLCMGWVAGLIGNNAGVNTWRRFYLKLVKRNDFRRFPRLNYWYPTELSYMKALGKVVAVNP